MREMWRCAAIVLGVFCVGLEAPAGPASVNPFRGRQQREDVFEFARPPAVEKAGDRWEISFASKAACDATVAIVGPDGRIVRHLVSGVLGRNAPWPFRQESLSQRLAWDGKDDFGRPAPAKCVVRVSLGLKPRLDTFLGEDRSFARAADSGLAVDRRGRVYGLGGPCVRVFDRDGRYLRTIMPPPASLPADRMSLVQWTRTTWGARTVYRPRSGGSSTFELFRYPGFERRFEAQVPAVGAGDRLFLITGRLSTGGRSAMRKLIEVDTKDGAVLPDGITNLDTSGTRGEIGVLGDSGWPSLAISPDGTTLYLSGFRRPGTPAWEKEPIHAVFRRSLDAPGAAQRFLGDPGAAGDDDSHFREPRGIACDKEGNLYVCDHGNDRIQVFRPDGRSLKTIPLEKPYQVAVHRNSGSLFVLTVARVNWSNKPDPGGHLYRPTLIRLGGLADPRVRARMQLPRQQHRYTHTMAVDPSSETPAIWLAGVPGWGLSRIQEKGGKLEKVLDVSTYGGRPEGWENWDPRAKRCYVVADRTREQLYIREKDCCFPSPVIRVDGRTGKLIERFEIRIEQVHVDLAGRVFMRLSDGGQWLVRYDPESGKFAPMAAPEARQAAAGGYGDRAKAGKGPPLRFKDRPIVGVYLPANFGARTWQDIFCAAPNGDVYVPAGLLDRHIAELEKAALDRPSKPAGCAFAVLRVYSPEGKLKCPSALPGLGGSAGVRVGRSGAVYAVLQCQPEGQTLPDGVAADGRFHDHEWGTLVKFNSRFDAFPVGRITGQWDGAKPEKVTHRYGNTGGSYRTGRGTPVAIENVHWYYGGVCPITMCGCTCLNSHFDLDGFERPFLPAAQTCTVNVLDSNGNLILRIGGYGNCDSRGKPSAVVDRETGLLRPRRPDDPTDLHSPLAEPEIAFCFPRFTAVTDEALYVHDMENGRIVRAAIGYHAEQTVPLPAGSP